MKTGFSFNPFKGFKNVYEERGGNRRSLSPTEQAQGILNRRFRGQSLPLPPELIDKLAVSRRVKDVLLSLQDEIVAKGMGTGRFAHGDGGVNVERLEDKDDKSRNEVSLSEQAKRIIMIRFKNRNLPLPDSVIENLSGSDDLKQAVRDLQAEILKLRVVNACYGEEEKQLLRADGDYYLNLVMGAPGGASMFYGEKNNLFFASKTPYARNVSFAEAKRLVDELNKKMGVRPGFGFGMCRFVKEVALVSYSPKLNGDDDYSSDDTWLSDGNIAHKGTIGTGRYGICPQDYNPAVDGVKRCDLYVTLQILQMPEASALNPGVDAADSA